MSLTGNFGKILCMIVLPEKVQRIIGTLQQDGYEAYAVGGCVRDSLLGRKPDDWDITTSARPEQVKALFRRTVDTGIKHGTVTVMFGAEGFEVTTYRIDGDYEDGRHPKEVAFTPDLKEDLRRRDFTINAMAYNDQGLVDLFDGQGDMERKLIRAVGEAQERFTEDALRILRAVRFSAQLDYAIEAHTKEAIVSLKDRLQLISAERIRVELQKLLLSDHPEKLNELYELGITGIVLREYDRLTEEERREAVLALQRSEKSVVIRLAVLLHFCKNCRPVLQRLKYDNATIRAVSILTEHVDDKIDLTPEGVRRFSVLTGPDLMPAMILFKRALGQDPEETDRLEKEYREMLKRADCISMKDLAVTGNDLILKMHMKPGKELGECLQFLFDRVLADPSLNDKEKLLALLQEKRESVS